LSSFMSSSLPPSLLLPSSPVPLPMTTAQPFSNETTPKRRRRTTLIHHQDCYLNCPFDWKRTTSKFCRRLNSSITRLTGLILKSFVLNVLNIWREKNLSHSIMKVNFYSLWSHLNWHKIRSHSQMRLARLETQLPSYIIHCLFVKIRLYRVLFNWYCLSWCIHAEEPQCKFWCLHH
jgi:hypothetical protein